MKSLPFCACRICNSASLSWRLAAYSSACMLESNPPSSSGYFFRYSSTVANASSVRALKVLDGDMDQYIHDNTEDELTHEVFINAYLASKGADIVDLDRFRALPSSKATGAQQIGRLTNIIQLPVDPPS